MSSVCNITFQKEGDGLAIAKARPQFLQSLPAIANDVPPLVPAELLFRCHLGAELARLQFDPQGRASLRCVGTHVELRRRGNARRRDGPDNTGIVLEREESFHSLRVLSSGVAADITTVGVGAQCAAGGGTLGLHIVHRRREGGGGEKSGGEGGDGKRKFLHGVSPCQSQQSGMDVRGLCMRECSCTNSPRFQVMAY